MEQVSAQLNKDIQSCRQSKGSLVPVIASVLKNWRIPFQSLFANTPCDEPLIR